MRFTLAGLVLFAAAAGCGRLPGGEAGKVILRDPTIEPAVRELANVIFDHKEDAARKLIDANPDLVNKVSHLKTTAIQTAIESDATKEFIEYLLSKGADLNVKTLSDKRTLLHQAAGRGRLELVQMFLAKKLDANAKDTVGGWTPLHVAFCAGDTVKPETKVAIVTALLDAKADINSALTSGDTPLIRAASYPDTAEAVKVLLKRGANINAVTTNGNTALHIAGMSNKKDVAVLLLAAGANPKALNKNKQTPYQLAEKDGKTETSKLLFEATKRK